MSVEKQRVLPFIVRREKTSILPNEFASGKPLGEFYRPKYVIMDLKFNHQRGLKFLDLHCRSKNLQPASTS